VTSLVNNGTDVGRYRPFDVRRVPGVQYVPHSDLVTGVNKTARERAPDEGPLHR
jgi:hypothetical protein